MTKLATALCTSNEGITFIIFVAEYYEQYSFKIWLNCIFKKLTIQHYFVLFKFLPVSTELIINYCLLEDRATLRGFLFLSQGQEHHRETNALKLFCSGRRRNSSNSFITLSVTSALLSVVDKESDEYLQTWLILSMTRLFSTPLHLYVPAGQRTSFPAPTAPTLVSTLSAPPDYLQQINFVYARTTVPLCRKQGI